MLQMQGETLYAAVAPGQKQGQIGNQALEGEQQGLMRFDVEIQLDTHIEKVRRRVALQRHRALADQCVEMLQDAGRKTSRQGVARQSQYLPHVAQAHARQGSGCFATQADALQRHLL